MSSNVFFYFVSIPYIPFNRYHWENVSHEFMQSISFKGESISFALPFTTFSIVSASIVGLTLILLGVFLTHTGEFTRFLHSLIFSYLVYYLWLECSSVVFRIEEVDTISSLEFRQEDSFFYRLFLLYSTFIVAVFFFGLSERFYLSKRSSREFPLLILFIYIAGLFIFRLHTLRDIFLALERVTLASYVLATFERQNRFSTYAGIQYFLLGSLPSARLILAFALFYLQGGSVVIEDLDLLFSSFFCIDSGVTSSFENQTNIIFDYFQGNFSQIVDLSVGWYTNIADSFRLSQVDIVDYIKIVHPITALTLRGLVFILFNLLFKLTAAPFHVWAPSVYGNAPIASVTFLSIYSKALILFFLFKLTVTFLHAFSSIILVLLISLGLLSLLVGRVGAFTEKRIKRFFVYSSRGHVGFRLVGIGISTLEGASAAFHYLAIYVISSFLRWFYPLTRGREKHHLTHFVSLKHTDPLLALIFAILVFSRSGIPPLGGFFIKLDVLANLLDDSHFFVNYVLFIFTVLSFFYYLRLIKILFFDKQVQSIGVSGINSNTVVVDSFSFEERPRYVGRLWLRVSIILFLTFYIVIIQKPLLALQQEVLSYLF